MLHFPFQSKESQHAAPAADLSAEFPPLSHGISPRDEAGASRRPLSLNNAGIVSIHRGPGAGGMAWSAADHVTGLAGTRPA
jgi:hypothetical protein